MGIRRTFLTVSLVIWWKKKENKSKKYANVQIYEAGFDLNKSLAFISERFPFLYNKNNQKIIIGLNRMQRILN